ncbi:MAG: N-acetylmuramoyl-L-alanine amidase [Desulfocapsaceae bacterium]|nr:N-acetylmuramoyl-L-alanine amidase [Desulfocapsaceae bacterium]
MLGKTYQQMFSRFNIKKDLDDAISSFQDCASLFPDGNLADDALWNVANIYLDNLNDKNNAIDTLKKIVATYPKGDMYDKSVNELKALTADSNQGPARPTGNNLRSKQLNHVLPIKYWSSHDYTRIVIDASGPVSFKEQLLEQEGNQPRRLYIDFANSYVQPKFRAPVPIEDGLLKRIRTGQYNADTVRVVLDIESISSYKVFSLPDPFRVVVDIRGVGRGEEAKSPDKTRQAEEIAEVNTPEQSSTEKIEEAPIVTKAAPEIQPEEAPSTSIKIAAEKANSREPARTRVAPQDSKPKIIPEASVADTANRPPPVVQASTSKKPLSLAQQLGLRVKKIVIDPGHGGKDPGAMANGLKEKDIVLNVAKRLAPLLEKRLGCKVILTRSKDVFIPLEERTAIANKNDADLFISLHVNSSESTSASGIETYYLNLTSNPEAMRVAAFENATSAHQMSDLQNILSDILKNSKISESSRLAQQVHNTVVIGINKNYSPVKNLGVKQAPFYVLIGAEMPAILIEMSFISNPGDAKHLNDDRYLDRLAYDISAGVQSYINSNTANTQTPRQNK